MQKLSRRCRALNTQANSLWTELGDLAGELNELGKERRRLTELLPWWAAPGRGWLNHKGELCGEIAWYPAIQDPELPQPGGLKPLRPSSYAIERMADNPFNSPETNAANKLKWMRDYEQRIADQKRLKREVGLTALERRLSGKWRRQYDIRKTLWDLADTGSQAAVAATIVWDFAKGPRLYEGSRTLGELGSVLPSVLKMMAPFCSGLLREHVGILLKHPKKEQRTCNFVRLSADADAGFVKIDRPHIPSVIPMAKGSQAA